MPRPECYVSTDIETDGPIPGPYSLLGLASVAYDLDGRPVGEFSVNLEPLPGAGVHPDTAAFFAQHPAAWAALQQDRRAPAAAMTDYAAWLRALPGEPVFVAYPAGFDFTFVYWYLIHFTGGSPFGFAALDMKSYAMAVLKRPFRATTKKAMPGRWFPEGLPHTHVALDDAREQGGIFLAMRRENLANQRETEAGPVPEGAPRG
jgi:hypothetical protein